MLSAERMMKSCSRSQGHNRTSWWRKSSKGVIQVEASQNTNANDDTAANYDNNGNLGTDTNSNDVTILTTLLDKIN